MNVTCHVVEDLMPLYAEQLASQDSCVLVEEHLKRCPSCRARLEVISQPAPLPLDRDTTPLKKLRSKLHKRQVLTVLISVLCAFALVASVLSFAFSPDYIPFQENLIEVEEQDGSLYLIPQQSVSGYETDCYSTPQGQVYHISLYQTLWDRTFDSFRPSSWYLNPKGEKIAAVYYASNNGTDDVLLYGQNQNPSGGVQSLPRLALGYYLIMAAGPCRGTDTAFRWTKPSENAGSASEIFILSSDFLCFVPFMGKGFVHGKLLHFSGFQCDCAGVSAFMGRAGIRVLLVENGPESKVCKKGGNKKFGNKLS